jgi:hypothetical protein
MPLLQVAARVHMPMGFQRPSLAGYMAASRANLRQAPKQTRQQAHPMQQQQLAPQCKVRSLQALLLLPGWAARWKTWARAASCNRMVAHSGKSCSTRQCLLSQNQHQVQLRLHSQQELSCQQQQQQEKPCFQHRKRRQIPLLS